MSWSDEEKEFREAGFTDDEISAEKTRLQSEMAENGFSGEEVNSYFGGKGQNPSKKRASKAESFGAGLSQVATWGYAPNIVGAGSEIAGRASGLPREALNYTQARDKTATDIKEAQKENPWTYMLGQGVGAAGAVALAPAALTANAVKTALSAGASGALYNPGETEGEYSGLQLPERAGQGVVSAAFGGASKLGADFIGKLARAYSTKLNLNKPGFGQKVQSQVKDSVNDLYEKYISPRSADIKNELKTADVSFRPDILKGTKTKNLRNSLNERVDDDFNVTLRGDKAERLRKLMDAKAGYSQSNALANPKVAKSGEAQKKAADTLRSKRNEQFPQLKKTFDEESYALGLAKEMMEKSKQPQSLLTSQFWGDTGSKVVDLDSMAGSNLRGLGEDIMRAKWMQGAPGQTVNKIPGVDDALRAAANAGGYVGRGMAPLTGKGISPTLMKMFLDAKYRESIPEGGQ